jgi:cleavage stimulation factor subunit 2
MSHQKHDIFVGNLSFTTTEEQLFTAFTDIGRVLGVRMVNDAETGKSRGFAFVEFEDPQAALAAIRNMNDYELNGRRLRVNFSNASHLEALASKLGMDLSANANPSSAAAAAGNKMGGGGPNSHHHHLLHQKNNVGKGGTGGGAGGMGGGGAASGATAIADALKALSKAEMYDIVAQFKDIADNDPDDARRILSGHPQLPEAMLFLMSKLDMIRRTCPRRLLWQVVSIPCRPPRSLPACCRRPHRPWQQHRQRPPWG